MRIDEIATDSGLRKLNRMTVPAAEASVRAEDTDTQKETNAHINKFIATND